MLRLCEEYLSSIPMCMLVAEIERRKTQESTPEDDILDDPGNLRNRATDISHHIIQTAYTADKTKTRKTCYLSVVSHACCFLIVGFWCPLPPMLIRRCIFDWRF